MDLDSWLRERQLGHLLPMLQRAGIDLDVIGELDDVELAGIGLTLGDRKRLIKYAKRLSPELLRTFESTSVTENNEKTTIAERRHLTVMFCDLVGSTEMAAKLDPEDLRELIDEYHHAIGTAVAPFEGHIAQFLGDGVLVYFGYPKAHEDDGSRAVLAAIAVLDEVSRVSVRSARSIQVRIGIASGLVVVGQIGSGTTAAEQSAIGETPNLASRLQSQARPGEIIIAEETRNLLGLSFELEPLDSLPLKGFKNPIRAWRLTKERVAASRFEAQHGHLTPLIGRESEVSMLIERWETSCDGEGQMILLSGEAGIGKSRIVQELRRRLDSDHFTTVLWQCSPYFSSAALYPVIKQLEHLARIDLSHSAQVNAKKLEDRFISLGFNHESLALLFRLFGLHFGEGTSMQAPPERIKAATLRALVNEIQRESRRQPLLLLIEDAHWIDPTTNELLTSSIERFKNERVMVLVTARPGFAPSWGSLANLTSIEIGRLGQRHCALLVQSVANGKIFPDDVLGQILRKTDGVPLFVEELTKTVVESGLLSETKNRYELKVTLITLSIPSTLQDSLMARLDRLAPAKEMAQAAAAIGRDFNLGLLAEVLNMSECDVTSRLEELVKADIIVGKGQIYSFKHALIRDAAYGSMVRPQRALRHGQIARAIERISPELLASQPDLLAQHYQEAGNIIDALRYWTAAGDRAFSQSDAREASIHFLNALKLVRMLPDEVEGKELELSLSLKRGHSLYATEGYASPLAFACFERARELALVLARMSDFLDAWVSSAPTLFSTGRPKDALDNLKAAGEFEMSSLEPRLRIEAGIMIGVANYLMGDVAKACREFVDARLLDDKVNLTHLNPTGGGDPAVVVRAYEARAKFLSGFLEQGEALCEEGVAISKSRGHAPSIAWATQVRLTMLTFRGEWATLAAEAEAARERCETLGFKTRVATALFRLGEARIAFGEVERGIEMIRMGYDQWLSSGGKFHLTEYNAQAAHDLLEAGRFDDARSFVSEGIAVQMNTDERYYSPELKRLSGELMLADGETENAEAAFRSAFLESESRELKFFSLRAAISLARLVKSQGRGVEARELLQPTFEWFGGLQTYPDLRGAKLLLDSLP